MIRKHLRIPEPVLRWLESAAMADGRSLNNYVVERVLKPHMDNVSQAAHNAPTDSPTESGS